MVMIGKNEVDLNKLKSTRQEKKIGKRKCLIRKKIWPFDNNYTDQNLWERIILLQKFKFLIN